MVNVELHTNVNRKNMAIRSWKKRAGCTKKLFSPTSQWNGYTILASPLQKKQPTKRKVTN